MLTPVCVLLKCCVVSYEMGCIYAYSCELFIESNLDETVKSWGHGFGVREKGGSSQKII